MAQAFKDDQTRVFDGERVGRSVVIFKTLEKHVLL